METVDSAPAGFLETNVVHLGAADPLPAFDIDAHFTYAGEQPLNAVAENVEHHCCRPGRLEAITLWVRDGGVPLSTKVPSPGHPEPSTVAANSDLVTVPAGGSAAASPTLSDESINIYIYI